MGMRFQYKIMGQTDGGYIIHKTHRGKTHAKRRLPKEFDLRVYRLVHESHGPRTARVLYNMPESFLNKWILMGKMN